MYAKVKAILPSVSPQNFIAERTEKLATGSFEWGDVAGRKGTSAAVVKTTLIKKIQVADAAKTTTTESNKKK